MFPNTSSEALPLVYLLPSPLRGRRDNVANFRHIFVGGDVLDAPRKNDVTLFPNTTSCFRLKCELVTLSRLVVSTRRQNEKRDALHPDPPLRGRVSRLRRVFSAEQTSRKRTSCFRRKCELVALSRLVVSTRRQNEKRDALHPDPPLRGRVSRLRRVFSAEQTSRKRTSCFRRKCELVALSRLVVSTRRQNEKRDALHPSFHFGDPYENRTRVTAVKGRCLSRLTNGPGSGDWT